MKNMLVLCLLSSWLMVPVFAEVHEGNRFLLPIADYLIEQGTVYSGAALPGADCVAPLEWAYLDLPEEMIVYEVKNPEGERMYACYKDEMTYMGYFDTYGKGAFQCYAGPSGNLIGNWEVDFQSGNIDFVLFTANALSMPLRDPIFLEGQILLGEAHRFSTFPYDLQLASDMTSFDPIYVRRRTFSEEADCYEDEFFSVSQHYPTTVYKVIAHSMFPRELQIVTDWNCLIQSGVGPVRSSKRYDCSKVIFHPDSAQCDREIYSSCIPLYSYKNVHCAWTPPQ